MGIEAETGTTIEASTDSGDDLGVRYLAECGERLAALRTDLLAMAKGEAGDETKLMNRVLRAVHFVRGAAFFGRAKVAELAAQMEDALARTAGWGMLPKPFQVRVLLIATDRLTELIQHPDAVNSPGIAATAAALARLNAEISPLSDKGCGSDADGQTRPMRALVVEDDFATRLLMKSFLSRYGECDVVDNGVQAVECFSRAWRVGRKYDLVCMDVRMPEMDGPEAVRQLRAFEENRAISPPCRVKIMIMTSVDDIKEMIRCFHEFSDAYLMKPVNLANLLRQLKSWQLIPHRQEA